MQRTLLLRDLARSPGGVFLGWGDPSLRLILRHQNLIALPA